MENNLFPKKINQIAIKPTRKSTLTCIPQRSESICSHKNMYIILYNAIIYNS